VEQTVGVKETRRLTRSRTVLDEKTVNEYVKLRPLGRGSYGKVVLYERREDELVSDKPSTLHAVKVLNKERLAKTRTGGSAAGATALGLVRSEVALMKRLSHKRIVRLEEVIDDPDHHKLFLVMEYLPGGALLETEEIGRATVPEPALRRYVRDVCSAVAYLHACNAYHGDLKPDNILLSESKRHAKVIDFTCCGHGEEDGEEALATRSPGTPSFTAPECCGTSEDEDEAAAAYSGQAADCWALGVTVYACLLGRLPFDGASAAEVFERLRREPVSLPGAEAEPNMSETARDFVAALLKKDPKERATAAQALEHPWIAELEEDEEEEAEGEGEEEPTHISALVSGVENTRIR